MKEIIKQRIAATEQQMITYADFIECALYHPEKGYYMKDVPKIGRGGDFYTTSNVSDVFGRLMGKWYANNTGKLNLGRTVCEIGGGNGRFAKAFIQGWNETSAEPLLYYLVETSPYHKQLQKELLSEITGAKVLYFEDYRETGMKEGLIFSNELFDAFPVHVIENHKGVIHEVFVGYEEGNFVEKLLPAENKEIFRFLKEGDIGLAEGQRMEVPLGMEPFLRSISEKLDKGILISVDYGYTKKEWMQPGRRNGSLRGYYKHQLYKDILQHPGEMDITSHVHFDALIAQGKKYGLDFFQKKRQDEFLLSIGILEELAEHRDSNPFSEASKQNRAIRSLIMPGGISQSFSVIIQGKNIGKFQV
ncbi:SAM-dependent methyltransferase [Bacillus sp. REN3]|uniref:class I SAM-dependent methyltransferase n=1 Tax=Bacillus sp. REN3 TaxID=2802440 RepID=UPI001AEE2844|nr:SAM-dependent methyltransferase [Bacillus sp. REN3]